MKNNPLDIRWAGLLCLAFFSVGTDVRAAALVTIDTVLVGNAGNADASASNTTHGVAGAYGYGGVNYDYRIGTYEVTINQYATFLDTVATSYNAPWSIRSLHSTPMEEVNIRGIVRTFGPTGYVYVVEGDGERPIGGVNWFGAARFANWMHNGATVGASTETGAYNLNGAYTGTFTREPGATVWVPSEDEWYKAAYYDPDLNGGAGGYYLHANGSNSMTSHDLNVPGASNYAYTNPNSPSAPGITLYPTKGNILTPVGSYNTTSHYGTYDQSGNMSELTDGPGSGNIVALGGFARSKIEFIGAASRNPIATDVYGPGYGFRLATTAVPEPSASGLLVVGAVTLVAFSRQRRKR